ncbi:glycosyltransferase family 2 protein [Patulibacter defluvii]|uniref:glycosyltransferase family 2 protein n=1 Tax=Patulibacter defluvii TaxID=3095358 RepID=UPI002A756BB8|nr:glycosyltransferase [Patulibacter sp. DM4]
MTPPDRERAGGSAPPRPAAPDVSVVIPTAGRRVGLLWALDALAAQELPEGATFEVNVVHGPERTPVLEAAREHPLVRSGVAAIVASDGLVASQKRNIAWRMGRAPLIAFTDDDCRPQPGWLAAFLAAHRAHPEGLLQGGAAIDPDQHDVAMRAPRPRLQRFAPPTPWAELCSMAFPRGLLEAVGGLDEGYGSVGEDTDLAWRMHERGAPWVAVPDAVVDHAVETPGLRGWLRVSTRFGETTRLKRRHPQLRGHFPLGIFWVANHGWLLVGAAGLGWAAARRDPRPAALALPYAAWHASRYGRSPKGYARGAVELPAAALIDAARIAGFVVWSARERTVLL